MNESLVVGYSCGVHLPVAPPNTELTILAVGSVAIQYQFASLKQGISEQHCPVSCCGENDILTPYNMSCTSKSPIYQNSMLVLWEHFMFQAVVILHLFLLTIKLIFVYSKYLITSNCVLINKTLEILTNKEVYPKSR